MKTVLLVAGMLCSQLLHSQAKNFGTWQVINTRYAISKHWSVMNELQLRSHSMFHDHFYHEVKGGVTYHLNKNFAVLIGGGKYHTYQTPVEGNFVKPYSANETRFWQQLTMNHYEHRIKFEHRYRVEQRWFTTGYRNRFRYRLAAAIPLNQSKITDKTFFISTFNELFFTNTAPYFERNRFFAGFGYKFSKMFSLQPGYVNQFDYSKTGTKFTKHFLQITLMIDIDNTGNEYRSLPTHED